MITLKKYLELNPTETEEERHLAEFAAKIEARLAETDKHLRDLMEEYADRRAQWGDEYLWRKHEDTELVEDIRRRLLENAEHMDPPTQDSDQTGSVQRVP